MLNISDVFIADICNIFQIQKCIQVANMISEFMTWKNVNVC